jgi:cyclic pyranopterin phosphate synthase
MVDVTGKAETLRRAIARCRVSGIAGAVALLSSDTDRADLLGPARLAGIVGAKATSSLIPLCHPVPLTDVDVEVTVVGDEVRVAAMAETVARTGVEMEALTACALAALSVVCSLSEEYPEAHVEDLTLWSKTGGRSGTWERTERGMHAVPEADQGLDGGSPGPDR